MTASILAPVLGRPKRTPRAFALSGPALTRLRIIARSNSASALVTWKNIRPAGVVVLTSPLRPWRSFIQVARVAQSGHYTHGTNMDRLGTID
jgi:hypothetical protein